MLTGLAGAGRRLGAVTPLGGGPGERDAAPHPRGPRRSRVDEPQPARRCPGRQPSTALRMIDRLLLPGLVTRTENRTNRRQGVLELTSSGRRLVRRVSVARRAEITRVVRGRRPSLQVSARPWWTRCGHSRWRRARSSRERTTPARSAGDSLGDQMRPKLLPPESFHFLGNEMPADRAGQIETRRAITSQM